ncbi:AMP-binding protein [Pseudonocardia thermophila]|uniref:AMP-binding protein n=1 Tax=Pseudonocardia thermophila TaxID=1848 RepID=UPI00248EB01F|nr:AMP-binding protein [Pseudonocardia thermophila]
MDNAVEFDVTTLRGRRAVHRWERTSVGDVFERLTWSYPDQTAIAGAPGAFGEPQFARVTNRQADALCNQLAHALAARGLEPGDRVLLFCENSVEAFLTKIGIAKAGMVAVPLNPALAPDVVTHLIELTEPKLAIVDAELWPRAEQTFTAAGLEVAAFVQVGGTLGPTFSELLAGQPETEPDVEIHGDDVWELLFTSGTTSMPKGAMVTHSSTYLAALNFALSLSRGVRHECDLKVATFLPMIYHVGDQIFTFSAFLSGGSIVLGRKPAPDAVAEAIALERATALWAGSPQFVSALADTLDARPELDVSPLTMLVYGWGALAPDLLTGLEKRIGPQFMTLGIFGQTEAIACHRFWPTKWPEVHRTTAPAVNYVGVPSPLLASDVVDELGEPVRGVPGEAVYRSPIITAGYYRNPQATAEAFRGGWFHSGDSAQVDEHGLRIMVDRYKDIVKTGGENVSSQRVEAVLLRHPGVARAAVVGLPHERWGEAVTAVVVPAEGASVTEEELIAHCREHLAGFETPKSVVFTDQLPETVGGKVLKYKLREEYAGHYTS